MGRVCVWGEGGAVINCVWCVREPPLPGGQVVAVYDSLLRPRPATHAIDRPHTLQWLSVMFASRTFVDIDCWLFYAVSSSGAIFTENICRENVWNIWIRWWSLTGGGRDIVKREGGGGISSPCPPYIEDHLLECISTRVFFKSLRYSSIEIFKTWTQYEVVLFNSRTPCCGLSLPQIFGHAMQHEEKRITEALFIKT